MGECIIEIDQLEDGHVVLAIPSLRFIVMGRTLDEAHAWARSAIAYRGLSLDPHPVASMPVEEMPRPPSSNAA
jgi:hypothetical protein